MSGHELVGLSSAEASALLRRVGPNSVSAPETSWGARLAGKLWSPVPWMLEGTALLELLLRRWADALLVLAVLGLNTAIGVIQEGRAQSAVDLLRSRLEVQARVRRDGQWARISAAGIVPGDAVHVRMGDFVPADLRVLGGAVLVDESGLTGESVPVEKGEDSSLYSGTVIVRGEASGWVTATGARTVFGKTTELVGSSAPAEHLGRLVLRMVRVFIGVDVLVAASGTTFLAAIGADVDTVLSFGVVLLLASVPVALPAAFTLAGALGARRLAERGVLTTRLSVIQDAARMDVLCTDKTGTLTNNRLVVGRIISVHGATADEVLRAASAASDPATQDPIDVAVLRRAQVPTDWVTSAFFPFDPASKRSEATVTTRQGRIHVTKGAPTAVSALTGQAPGRALAELAADGSRVIAVGAKAEDGPWRTLGHVALHDSVRDDAREVLDRLRELGVRIIMVTGDSVQTAQSVASQLGLPGTVVTAEGLADSAADWGSVAAVAEVLPDDKHHLVLRLQQAGHIVGMTGDGVNDAPALRQAEVGIAVEGAADVAKAAAGAVLTSGGLADVVDLLEESRRIHQRSLTYALNVSVKKIEIPLLLGLGVFVWREFVFTPLLMALLLLANDVVSMAVTTDRVRPSRQPDVWRVSAVIAGAITIATPMLLTSTGVLWAAHAWLPGGLKTERTLIFLTLVLSSQATIHLVRTGMPAWRDRASGWLLGASVIDVLAATALCLSGALMDSIGWGPLLGVGAAVLAASSVADVLKVPVFRRLGLHAPAVRRPS